MLEAPPAVIIPNAAIYADLSIVEIKPPARALFSRDGCSASSSASEGDTEEIVVCGRHDDARYRAPGEERLTAMEEINESLLIKIGNTRSRSYKDSSGQRRFGT